MPHSLVINTNVPSIVAQNATKHTDRLMTNAMEKLSTGYRINDAGDDAAGLAIAAIMSNQILGTNMAGRNASHAIAMVQVADGALNEVSTLMQRMRELAVQASTETYTTNDLQLMQTEYVQLEDEIDRIVDQTRYNTMNILNGVGSQAGDDLFVMQVGANSGDTITLEFGTYDISITGAALNDLDGLSINSRNNAQSALTSIDDAFQSLGANRARLGSYMNRLGHALNNTEIYSQNLSDSRSRVEDTDYAYWMAQMARHEIVRQASMAMLSTANVVPKQVLQLLQ
jgi:flagellin